MAWPDVKMTVRKLGNYCIEIWLDLAREALLNGGDYERFFQLAKEEWDQKEELKSMDTLISGLKTNMISSIGGMISAIGSLVISLAISYNKELTDGFKTILLGLAVGFGAMGVIASSIGLSQPIPKILPTVGIISGTIGTTINICTLYPDLCPSNIMGDDE